MLEKCSVTQVPRSGAVSKRNRQIGRNDSRRKIKKKKNGKGGSRKDKPEKQLGKLQLYFNKEQM